MLAAAPERPRGRRSGGCLARAPGRRRRTACETAGVPAASICNSKSAGAGTQVGPEAQSPRNPEARRPSGPAARSSEVWGPEAKCSCWRRCACAGAGAPAPADRSDSSECTGALGPGRM
eukprot:7086919-Lingulodinium_polyedra.AAC.1